MSRLGHAYLVGETPEPEQALAVYQEALELADQIAVPRFRAESLIGSAVALGIMGDLERALDRGLEALDLLCASGDAYLAALTQLALGGAAARTSDPRAEAWLVAARDRCAEAGELYVRMMAWAWLGRLWLSQGRHEEGRTALASARELAEIGGLQRALRSAPWLGPPTAREAARVEPADPSPATPVAIRTLGRFDVRLDGRVLAENGWGRRAARELLWLLCSRSDHTVSREEAIDVLWPDSDRQTGSVRLRVALYALHATLEPARAARSATRVVHATAERIWLDERVEVDVDRFLAAVRAARRESDPEPRLERGLHALSLFSGPFLVEGCHLDWIAERGLRLRDELIDVAVEAGAALLAQEQWREADDAARTALAQDPCCEAAYLLLIRARLGAGDTPGARRAFEQCRRHLAGELGVEPSSELMDLAGVTRLLRD